MKSKFFLYAALLLLTQCSKCKQDDPTPEEQLPPATQTGANTFGCLVNGQVYTPSGYNGTSDYAVLYDPAYNGGSLDVRTYRYTKSAESTKLSIIIGGDSINHVGTYSLTATGSRGALLFDRSKPSPCDRFAGGVGVYTKGILTLTRLDLNAGIISGTFEFTLAKPGCDTIRVTQGRFDKKL
ncbi:hypothetical protein GCM10022406_14860 [Hymenobacter algoricola]|uniref:Lipoprotein n=2 Tax=Hymenobacter algoricola TaxID=486267 RepID=A0ABP7MV94_9BACT